MKIAVMPGDFVGKEVVAEGLKVLKVASQKFGFKYDTTDYPFGAEHCLKTKELIPDKNFNTFLKIFTHPKSSTIPITSIGLDHLQTFSNFVAKWYAGDVKDLQGGLQEVDKTIDSKIKQKG